MVVHVEAKLMVDQRLFVDIWLVISIISGTLTESQQFGELQPCVLEVI